MRIQHNIPAMNSYRNYNNNNSRLGKNLEKLSSGYAINRAGDDAAGLAISEKMRAQITGIEVASKNAKDGISVVQAAEGALTEVHDMLNRMFALSEQANNGIYQTEEREKLQAEIDQLATEIDRIGDSTNFNGMKLLDGTLQDAPVPTFANSTVKGGGTDSAQITSMSFKWSSNPSTEVKKNFSEATSLGKDWKVATAFYAASAEGPDKIRNKGDAGALYVDLTSVCSDSSNNVIYHIKSATINKSAVDATCSDDFSNFGKISGSSVALTDVSNKDATVLSLEYLNATEIAGGTITITLADADDNVVGTLSFGYGEINKTNAGKVVEKDTALNTDGTTGNRGLSQFTRLTLTGQNSTKSAVKQGALSLQIGDSTNSYDKMLVSVDSMKSADLGVNHLDIIGNATDAMGLVTAAIERVSVQRGALGAFQNRLEHTLNNLSVMKENIQDAEATIRDTDMAEEMMKYTKNTILVQSAQAMLAQANQLPQGVLSLLQ